ncbi:MAG: MoxR family ATPase [Actinomycetia bacterium]|nr:MoxR family ATPase [Actinomycetes bacterium]MCP4959443.1 MoxR family ATPase [Actinomycetes bacterium]
MTFSDAEGVTGGGSSARDAMAAVRDEIGKVIVGQQGVVTGILTAMLVEGHVLLEGVPGVAKTLTVSTLAHALDLDTRRVQFTPDLMPSDLTGQLVLEPGKADFVFRHGPVFTNLLLADELNRTPPKTQAALLESMQERQVSTGGATRPLPDPFIVIATQNPIEHEGTYPLPEAQLDRFLFLLLVDYPSQADEIDIMRRHHDGVDMRDPAAAGVSRAAGPADLAAARAEIQRIGVDDRILTYIVDLARATRSDGAVELGVSPRGASMLLHAAKAWTWMSGRSFVSPDEVQAMARPALRHRVRLRADVVLDGSTPDDVLGDILSAVPVPR